MTKIKLLATAFFITLSMISAASAQIAPPETQAQAPMPVNAMMPRVCLALPKVNFFEPGVSSAEMAASIRQIAAGYFPGTGAEAVALDTRLAQAINAEAKEKSCFFVLQMTVSRKRGGGKLGSVAPVLGGIAPVAGLGGKVAGTVAQAVLYTAADLASATKAKDEFVFEYSLVSTEDEQVKAAGNSTARAKSDGEDILSPMLEKMMEAVLPAVK